MTLDITKLTNTVNELHEVKREIEERYQQTLSEVYDALSNIFLPIEASIRGILTNNIIKVPMTTYVKDDDITVQSTINVTISENRFYITIDMDKNDEVYRKAQITAQIQRADEKTGKKKIVNVETKCEKYASRILTENDACRFALDNLLNEEAADHIVDAFVTDVESIIKREKAKLA